MNACLPVEAEEVEVEVDVAEPGGELGEAEGLLTS